MGFQVLYDEFFNTSSGSLPKLPHHLVLYPGIDQGLLFIGSGFRVSPGAIRMDIQVDNVNQAAMFTAVSVANYRTAFPPLFLILKPTWATIHPGEGYDINLVPGPDLKLDTNDRFQIIQFY